MTHDQYWLESPWLAVIFRKAHQLKRDMKSQEFWLQGLYISQAFDKGLSNFGQAFSKHRRAPEKYIQQPIRLSPLSEEERRQKILDDRKKVIAYFTNLQRRYDRKGSDKSG